MSARDLIATPGQTVGPFFHDALPFPGDNELVAPGRADAIRLHGRVLDGAGAPVPDALIELWQADADGRVPREPGSLRRDGFTFTGWGRAASRRMRPPRNSKALQRFLLDSHERSCGLLRCTALATNFAARYERVSVRGRR